MASVENWNFLPEVICVVSLLQYNPGKVFHHGIYPMAMAMAMAVSLHHLPPSTQYQQLQDL
jgi:hypothetical protein